jgi:hypothetical protein
LLLLLLLVWLLAQVLMAPLPEVACDQLLHLPHLLLLELTCLAETVAEAAAMLGATAHAAAAELCLRQRYYLLLLQQMARAHLQQQLLLSAALTPCPLAHPAACRKMAGHHIPARIHR